jgi:uncharacterized membrane protein (UPF0127 family)
VKLATEDGLTICERCELADSPLARMKGLLGRNELRRGEGLHLRPAASIHTLFMRFPIDAIFLDRDFRVLSVREHVKPWRVAAQRRSQAVLELAAGEARDRRISIGDRLALG